MGKSRNSKYYQDDVNVETAEPDEEWLRSERRRKQRLNRRRDEIDFDNDPDLHADVSVQR